MKISTSALLSRLSALVKKNGGRDNLIIELESALARIMSAAWSWNWKETNITSTGHLVETGATWTYTAGDNFIVSDIPLAVLDYTHTGRVFFVENRKYKTTDIGILDPNKVYVDKIFTTSGELEDSDLPFIREDFALNTSKIRSVSTDQQRKLVRLSPDYFKRRFNLYNYDFASSEPIGYYDTIERVVPPPVYAPSVTSGSTAGSFALGEYIYFFTRIDLESGEESDPGPATRFVNTSTNLPEVIYGSPDGDVCVSNFSYALKLYRTRVNPTRSNAPVYCINTRSPELPASTFEDSYLDSDLPKLDRFWYSTKTIIKLYPPPSDQIRHITVNHIGDFGFSLEESDTIDLGPRDQVAELIIFYVDGRLNGSMVEGQIKFNRQLNYLLSIDKEAGQDDYGPENYDPIESGDHGDWVDRLRWNQ